MMLKNGKWLGYLVYTMVLTTGLLYYRFPSDAIQAYLVSEAANADPPMVLTMGTLRPGFPPRLDLVDAAISLRETPQQALIQAGSISIAPAPWSFIAGAPRYHVDAHAYNGNIEGHVSLERHAVNAPFAVSLRLKGLHIGLHPYVLSLLGRDVSGVLDGDIHYAGLPNSITDGAGEGILSISDGRVKLLQPILGLEAIDFDRLNMKLALKDRRLSLAHVELEGRSIKGELSGTVMLNADISRSRLDLKGTLEPLGGLLETMKGNTATLSFLRQGLKKLHRSFVIQGTFKNPVFRFV